jgi:hypothetical protein
MDLHFVPTCREFDAGKGRWPLVLSESFRPNHWSRIAKASMFTANRARVLRVQLFAIGVSVFFLQMIRGHANQHLELEIE